MTSTSPQPIARLRRRYAAAPWATLAELAARAGYMARGAVYIAVGSIALLAAVGVAPEAQGPLGALEAWSRWPAGLVLIWAVGLGLYGFASWRGLQAVFDADRVGERPTALFGRVGQGISGLVYLGLAIGTFGVLDVFDDFNEAEDRDEVRAAVEMVLGLPFGDLMVIAAGLFIAGVGLANMIRAGLGHFGRTLKVDARTARWAGTLARIGYFGRGLAFLPAGLYTAAAGLHARAADARGLGGALEEVKAQSGGGIILSLLALGLVAFGLFALMEAWFRPIRTAAVAAGD